MTIERFSKEDIDSFFYEVSAGQLFDPQKFTALFNEIFETDLCCISNCSDIRYLNILMLGDIHFHQVGADPYQKEISAVRSIIVKFFLPRTPKKIHIELPKILNPKHPEQHPTYSTWHHIMFNETLLPEMRGFEWTGWDIDMSEFNRSTVESLLKSILTIMHKSLTEGSNKPQELLQQIPTDLQLMKEKICQIISESKDSHNLVNQLLTAEDLTNHKTDFEQFKMHKILEFNEKASKKELISWFLSTAKFIALLNNSVVNYMNVIQACQFIPIRNDSLYDSIKKEPTLDQLAVFIAGRAHFYDENIHNLPPQLNHTLSNIKKNYALFFTNIEKEKHQLKMADEMMPQEEHPSKKLKYLIRELTTQMIKELSALSSTEM